MNRISDLSVIKGDVNFGHNVVVEEFCILGLSPSSDHKPIFVGDRGTIRAGTYIYSGVQIGRGFQSGNKVNIRHNCVVGDNVSVGTQTVLEHHVTIGSHSRIHSSCFIPEFTIVGHNCWIGPNTTLTNAKYPNRPDTKLHLTGDY